MIRWFAGHPTAGNLLLILILAMGAFAAPDLIRETFPEHRTPEVSIIMAYRGATAADVEEAICQRLGNALQRVDHMEEFLCTSRDNRASAVASMQARGNMGRFLDDIRTEIDALTDLPEEAEEPVIQELHRTDLVASLAVSGPMSFNDLETYASDIENRLFRLPGVADVVVRGLSQRQWQIEISRDNLRQFNLSTSDIVAAIRRQNLDMPLGTIETAQQDIQLRFVDQRRSPRELMEIAVIGGPSGGELTLGDIAQIRETHEREEERVTFNGQRAIVLEVHKSRHEDALRVMDDLETFRQQELDRQDHTVNLDITQDMTSIVRDRLQMLVENGIVGLLLVGFVLSLFFRPRLALWALFGLPAAFAGAFVVMALTGLSLNMITLVALLMSIGIVMDDAVVITENIVRESQDNTSPLQAAIDGTSRILPGVLSSFLTTTAVFVPLAFLAGELGRVLEVLPVVLITALAASLIEAFWILPHHLKGSLAAPQQESRFRSWFNRQFERLREMVGRIADWAIRIRYGVLALVLLILLGSAGVLGGGYIKLEAMPDIDGDVLEARLLMPQGTPFDRTQQVVSRIEKATRDLNSALTPEQPAGQPLIRNTLVRYGHHPGANEQGPHVATVMIDLLTAENRSIDLDELIERWHEAIGNLEGVISLNIQEPGFGPAGIPIELRLQGNNLELLKEASTELSVILGGYRGTFNVLDDLRPGKPQRILSLREGALPLGTGARDIAGQIRTGLLGDIVDTIQLGDQRIEILLRHEATERNTLDYLDDTVIISNDGQAIPLSTVVQIKEERTWGQITRIDGQRTITLSSNIDSRVANASAIVADLQASVFPRIRAEYPGVDIVVEGQTARSRETGQSIARGLLIGLLGIFLILSFQFRSYIEPVIVMISIPVAFMGAVWGHILMGYNLSLPSLIGAASLAGIVVNNAILLVQFIKMHRGNGLDVIQAAGKASRDRFRAIFITSTTTIAGLLPLLAETSTQAMAVIPLVISVVFGLMVSTVVILIALPAFYVILDDMNLTTTLGDTA